MIDKYMYFIQLAKDLNITEAARKLYLSQQSLSVYLKKLEDFYDATLFNRKPRLSLTPVGEAVLKAYRKIEFLEKQLATELEDIKSGTNGSISLGIYSSRSTFLLPAIFAEFKEKYPNITSNIIDGVTSNFEEMLLNGELDFFIGIKPKNAQAFDLVPLFHENMYLIISDDLLEKYFSTEYPSCKNRFKNGIDLAEFSQVPFLFHGEPSRVSQALQEYLQKRGLKLKKAFSSNSGELRVSLSGLNLGASFITQLRFNSIKTYNRNNQGASHLNIFPINDLHDIFSSYIVYNKYSYQPAYMKDFLELVSMHFNKLYP